MLDTYCFTCHNTAVKAGGLALDALNLQNAPDDAKTWEKALRKLRGHLMPPPGNPQPPQKDVDSFTALDGEHARLAIPRVRTAGYVPVQRLNRTEYAASVKDLLGVEVNEKDILPQDIQVEGFDNIASVLTTSPAFLDQYLDAARRVAKKAVGDMAPPISGTGPFQRRREPGSRSCRSRRACVDATRWQFTQNFPADGEYRFSFSFDEQSTSVCTTGETAEPRRRLVLMIDGKRRSSRATLGGAEDLRLANVERQRRLAEDPGPVR